MQIRRISRQKREAQDFQGYFQDDVPDYAVGMLGSGSVDASQIKGMFNKVDDAIRLVNKFDSSFLVNVSFIFNFSKGGAYGVYLPELDRAIKTKALGSKLEGMGYKIEQDGKGVLTAYSTREDKTSDEIQADIDRIYLDIESQGGTAFGINMNDVLSSAREDATSTQSEDPNVWEWMATLHLGATIVHEAVHAKGNESEGPSESAEAAFLNWALPIINEEYRKELEGSGHGDLYSPLIMTGKKRHAKGENWYKTAQMSFYIPPSFRDTPTGSDLSGRFPIGPIMEQGMAEWSMIAQENQSVPIETRLGRQYMAPIPEDLSQEHDIYESQLRKITRDNEPLDTTATTEELLQDRRDEARGYDILEALLEEKRVKPLLLPIKKEASKIRKVATLFGWMNNLEISDGSTIPGLGDRVMAWDDRDEDFSEEEDWIRRQTRYNPTYDIKGFYYRWIEPRFQPELWDSMVQNHPGVHPAKRFAAKIDTEILRLISILTIIGSKITNGDICGTRLVMTDDVLPLAEKVLDTCHLKIFEIGESGKDKVYSVWACNGDITEDKIEIAEAGLTGEMTPIAKITLEEITGYIKSKEDAIDEIIEVTRKICDQYGIKDVYIVGGYPRSKIMKEGVEDINDLDFSGAWPNQCIKVGGLVAEELGIVNVDLYHRTMTLSFEYKGVKIDFRGNFVPTDIRRQLRKNGIRTTPLNLDIYNRDFTINMLVYDIRTGKIYDISGRSIEDIKNGVIKTILSPKFVCKENPLIIMRALKFHLKYGFKIDEALQAAMIENSPRLFDGRYSKERLSIARENVNREGRKDAERLFEEYGLKKIEEV